MSTNKPASAIRTIEHGVDKVFVDRWSPRAMSGTEVSREELMTLFEAARWAPSSYNEQPWRFSYGIRGTKQWDTLFSVLVDFNKGWAKNAGALLLIVSRKISTRNSKPLRTHSFDTGAAWQNLALQGSLRGLVVHGMEGFDYDRVKSLLNISDDYQIEAMAAIGKPADKSVLSPDLQEREVPGPRRDLNAFVFEGEIKEWSQQISD